MPGPETHGPGPTKETEKLVPATEEHSIYDPNHAHVQRSSKAFEYARRFNSREQTWRLFREQGTRLAITIILVVLLIITLKLFQNAGNVSHKARNAFNVVITILSLALGLNFLEAFKDMAKVYRWRILASGQYTIRETDLILGGESLTKLIHLMVESWKKPVTLIVCASWIALNLLAQASIAMIGLTYSMNSGANSNDTITSPGLVNAASIDCYYDNGQCSRPPWVAPELPQIRAHTYGEFVTAQTKCSYASSTDILDSDNQNQNCYYYGRNDGQEFAFRYVEYSPDDTTQAYPYLTNRIITASASACYEYTIDMNNASTLNAPDGISEIRVLPYHNTTYNSTINVPKPDAANDATTYIYYGTQEPQNETAIACSPRCLTIYAWRASGTQTDRPQTLFQCSITVSEVSNATQPAHQLDNGNARLAASSIALQGRYNNPLPYNPPDGHFNSTRQWRQYQLYPWGSPWETNNLLANQIGARISQYAVGSLAAMAHLNPTTTIPGTLPTLGYQLGVTWPYLIALTACIVGVHSLLVALMLWYSSKIVVLDDSNLVVARLLNSLVGGLGRGGSLMDGRDVARAIQRQEKAAAAGGGGGGVSFGVAVVGGGDGGRTLELGEGGRRRGVRDGVRFREGEYL